MSQGVYKILEAREGRSYDGKHGRLVVWSVRLENATAENVSSGMFELHKKPGNTPQPGDTVEVDRFSPGEFNGEPFVRIFAASQQQSAGGSTPSARSSDGPGLAWKSAPYERGAEHPRNEVRMIHTSALSAAPAYIDQMLTIGVAAQPKDEQAYWALVGHVAGRLAKSYAGALDGVSGAQAASQPPQNGSQQGMEVPADTREMAPAAAAGSDDSDIPF